jgi:hypothetical protein
MAAILDEKIDLELLETKPCVCGEKMVRIPGVKRDGKADAWLCQSFECGARGLSYEGALRSRYRTALLHAKRIRERIKELTN